jgi:hypothetical protein
LSAAFRPAGAVPPARLRAERFVLQPLRASDVERDYDAVMSSRAELRRWSQSTWPAEDFTLAENRDDLERHEREHGAGEAYTYTVLAPDGPRCLGCVYLAPLLPAEAALPPLAVARHAARVTYWVRAAEVAGDLDRALFDELRDWLWTAWWFDRVAFTVAAEEERQQALCRAAGLLDAGVYALPGRGERRVFVAAPGEAAGPA